MSNKDKPAYPESIGVSPMGDVEHSWETGLTKLEAFTMAALQGLCANPEGWDLSAIALSTAAVSIAKDTLAALEADNE